MGVRFFVGVAIALVESLILEIDACMEDCLPASSAVSAPELPFKHLVPLPQGNVGWLESSLHNLTEVQSFAMWFAFLDSARWFFVFRAGFI